MSSESNLKDVTLELVGKSPTVISDRDQAIKWAFNGILYVLDFSASPNPDLSFIIALSISVNTMGACQSISVSMPLYSYIRSSLCGWVSYICPGAGL